ncbi:PucR family transcriptional regulator ligand-binding domain-containing protein [Micromonospora sp. WMMD1102]|uniref:PucR family transcriptional regulator n=1 Tax=Micromonospora sp. WMMD1102 TaxID=3016105 RepID=UPI002414D0B0|nr:PucR family transcriptional regulator ligand-binding domain-containing protein [Micromonospora sp. WMMD1102]MDG4788461.1 PucR family transcriptional regulator ligand-binding domain-containing protein [Micromonospora sp. WMMD1102]
MFPTVREVLALDSVRHGGPRMVAGAAGLDRLVRWVHAAEVPDIAALLSGGELVLTTGIGLPGDDAGLRAFIGELADVGVSGLLVELGRRYPAAVPRAMVAAAEQRNLPLVELCRVTPFVRITEAVHALIVDAQLTELRATEEIHQRFTELSVEGAEPAEVVRQAALLAGCPVVLENLSRQVLAYDPAGESAELLLRGWEQHSRRIRPTGRTGYDPDAGWLYTTVGARGQDWGRLLLRWPSGELPARSTPPTRLTILVERAASTLALGRLIRRDAEGLERQIHRTLLTALLDHTRPVDEVALRARALGVPLDRRHLVGVVVRYRADDAAGPAAGSSPAGQARLRDLAEAVGQALRDAELSGLASTLDDQAVGAVLALRDAGEEETALAAFAAALHRVRLDVAPTPTRPYAGPGAVIVAAGSGVGTVAEARRSLTEARQVADAARRGRRDLPVFRLPQVGLAGLLHLLRDEPRLQTFVERELGPLLAHDAEHPREQLLGTLRGYLESGRNKSAAATAAHLSRPAFYERLARISRILRVDLDSVDDCLSLHVALLALDAVRDG